MNKLLKDRITLIRSLEKAVNILQEPEKEKMLACKIAMTASADFVKTSTGFSSGGASISDVRLMKQTVGDTMQVKASGGIKDWDTAAAMIQAGASRIGTSSGVTILQNAPKSS